MKQVFLLLLFSAIKVHGSHFNFENAFEDEKMDECFAVYHLNEPVRGMGVPFCSATTNTVGISNTPSTSQPVNSSANLFIRQPNAPQYNTPQNNAPSYNIPPPPLTLYPHAAPHPQIQAYCAPTDQGHGSFLPPNSTGLPPNPFYVPLRGHAPIHDPHQDFLENFYNDPKNYAVVEVETYRFRKRSRKDLMSKMILDIASNDYTSYLANEKDFKTEFGTTYEGFKIAGVNYVYHYIIYFGATNFVEVIRKTPKSSFDEMNLEKAFKYLIDKKPMETFITIFRECEWLQEEDKKDVFQLIKAKYPRLHPLDYLFLELPRKYLDTTDDAFKIFKAPTEAQKFAELKDFLIRHKDGLYFEAISTFCLKAMSKIPAMYPEFFRSLPNQSKLLLAKLAVIHDNVETLVQIIQLDENIMLMNPEKDWSLFELAARLSRNQIIEFLINVVPELAFQPQAHYKSPIYSLLIYNDNLEMIKRFEEARVSSEDKILNGKNAIQVAFELGATKIIIHFIQSFGKEKVLGYLIEVYGSKAEIIQYASKYFYANFVAFINEKLMT